jgi:hypothetical protein
VSTSDGWNADPLYERRMRDIVQLGAIGMTLAEIDARTGGNTSTVIQTTSAATQRPSTQRHNNSGITSKTTTQSNGAMSMIPTHGVYSLFVFVVMILFM